MPFSTHSAWKIPCHAFCSGNSTTLLCPFLGGGLCVCVCGCTSRVSWPEGVGGNLTFFSGGART